MLLRLTEHRLYTSNMQVDENAIMFFSIFNTYIKRFKTGKTKMINWKKISF